MIIDINKYIAQLEYENRKLRKENEEVNTENENLRIKTEKLLKEVERLKATQQQPTIIQTKYKGVI